jgi:hypothetical protein
MDRKYVPSSSAEDFSAEMVAVLDKIPKTIVQRLVYNGKVKDAKLWRKMVEAALRSRIPEKAYTCVAGKYEFHNEVALAAGRGTKEDMHAKGVLEAYGAFLLPLIDRDTSEGAALLSTVLGRPDLMEDGYALMEWITNRGELKTVKDVEDQKQKLAHMRFELHGDLEAHEITKTLMVAAFERIAVSERGGASKLQEYMINAIPNELPAVKSQLETQTPNPNKWAPLDVTISAQSRPKVRIISSTRFLQNENSTVLNSGRRPNSKSVEFSFCRN